MATSYNETMEFVELKKDIDDMFLLINGIIVSFMQAGFACLESGAVRTKNTTNIMMKNLLDLFICSIFYYLIGFPLAYGNGSSFIGLTYWAGNDFQESRLAFWFFQFVFAATAATILSGAVAERCNFIAYIVYSGVISGFVYPVVSHWAWHEEGWMKKMGYKDFAGSGVVHALAGMASFVAASFLGPRKGRFPGQPISGHSTPLLGLGALLLISGFLAFNGGSLGQISGPGDSELVARSMVSTIFGGTGAAIVALVFGRCLSDAPWPFSFTLNCTLAGMVSVCGGPEVYNSWSAMIVGGIGSIVYIGFHLLITYIKVDDPLDASPLHFGAGAWGVLARPIFENDGLIYGNIKDFPTKITNNIIGVLAIMAWSAGSSIILFGALKVTGFLRISEEEEIIGLDLSKHGENAYPSSAWERTSSSWVEGDILANSSDCKLEKINYDNYAFQMEKRHER
ncbi:putative ammonium transporter 1 [Halyomorpha halys]|uniref:putative ammonium transporter 1 n=1 Tax=Halyomorpha halys TaxID=286706 RepID=UPI0006D4F6F1|nr:putative ammonium transporter 1 [Halyomorpha halys]